MQRQLLIALLAIMACGRVASEPEQNGDARAKCSDELCRPYVCDRRALHCRTDCTTSTECASGLICSGGFCVGTDCTVDNAADKCGGYSCVAGRCSRECGSAACLPGFYCRGDTKHCVRKCGSREDPLCRGYLCDVTVGECEPYCFAGELGCAAGYTCTSAMTCAL